MAVRGAVPTTPLRLPSPARGPAAPRSAAPRGQAAPRFKIPTKQPGMTSLPHITVHETAALRPIAAPSKTELGLTSSSSKVHIASGSSFMGTASNAAGQLTPLQQAEIQRYLAERGHPRTFVDEILSGGSSVLGKAIDLISRPGWAVAGAAHSYFDNGSVLHGAEQGFLGHTHYNWGDILREHGWLQDHTFTRAVSGITLDILTDPTNLILIAGTPFTGGASGEAFLAKEGLVKGLGELGTKATVGDLIEQSAKHEAALQQVLSEPIASLGKTFGELSKADLQTMSHSEFFAHMETLARKESMALVRKSAEKFMPKKLTVGVWFPTLRGGRAYMLKNEGWLRVMPYAPSTLRWAEGRGVGRFLVGGSRGAELMNDLFKPGWRDPVLHASEQGRKYHAQALYNMALVGPRGIHSGFIEKWTGKRLAPEAEMKAVDTLSEHGGVMVDRNGKEVINEDFMRQQGLSPDEIQFAHDFHEAMQRQDDIENTYGVVKEGRVGVEPGESVGRGYVPYRVTRQQAATMMRRGIKQSFQHGRAGDNYSLSEFKAMAEAGDKEAVDVITDPMELFQARVLAGANAMAHAAWRHGMADLYGAPAKVLDPFKVAELQATADQAAKAAAEHHGLVAQMPADHRAFLEELSNGIADVAKGRAAQIDEQLRQVDEQVNQLRGLAREQEAQRVLRAEAKQTAEPAAHDLARKAMRNARSKHTAAINRLTDLMGQSFAASDRLAQLLSEKVSADGADVVTARELEKQLKGIDREVRGLNKELRAIEAEAKPIREQLDVLRQQSDGEIDTVATATDQAFRESKLQSLSWIADELAALRRDADVPKELASGQRVTIGEVREAIAADLRIELQKVESLVQRVANSGSQSSQALAIVQEGALRAEDLRQQIGKVVGARGKRGLLEIAGDTHAQMIDRIGRRRGADSLDSPEVQKLTRLYDKVREAQTGERLAKLVGEHHPSLSPMHEVSHAITPSGEQAAKVNELAEAMNALDARQFDAAHLMEAARQRREDFVKQYGEQLRESAGFAGREKERQALVNQARKEFDRIEKRLATQRDKVTDRMAELRQAQQQLLEVGPAPRGPAPKFYDRTIEKLEKQKRALVEGRTAAVARSVKAANRNLEVMEKKLRAAHVEALRMSDVMDERAAEAADRAEAGAWKPNHDLLAQGYGPVSGQDGILFPRNVKDAMERVEAIYQQPEEWDRVSRWFWKQMAKWKLMVTVLNPVGYRVRNTISDVWNAYLKGMPLRAWPKYLPEAVRMLRAVKRGDPQAMMFLMRAEQHGVMQGLFRGDVEYGLNVLKKGKARGNLFERAYLRPSLEANTFAENAGRLAHMLWRMGEQHEDFSEAAWHVREAHFDYEDLTDFEQHKMKAWAPFYTWTRKNVPFQLRSLFARPGRVAAFSHVIQEFDDQAPGKHGELVPSFFHEIGAFRVPGIGAHWYFVPQIGLMDISRMSSVDGIVGMLGPQLQLPVSLYTNKNLFTGGQIRPDTHQRTPINGTLAELLSVIPFSDVGRTERAGPHGQIAATGASPNLVYLLESSGIPLLRFWAQENPVTSSHTGPGQRILGQLGVPLMYADQGEQKQILDIQQAEQEKAFIRNLRDLNVLPEAKRTKLSANEKLIQRLRYQAYGRP